MLDSNYELEEPSLAKYPVIKLMVHWKENKQTFRDGHAFYHNFHQKSDYWTPQLLRRTAFNFPSQDQRTSKGLKNKGTDHKGENSLIFTKFSQ